MHKHPPITGVGRNFSRGRLRRHFAYPYSVADDAMQMDVHKTLLPFFLHCKKKSLSQGAHISVPSSLNPKRKLRSPKLKYEVLEISEVRGPFERKVLMHYSYFGPLWKQDIYTLQLPSLKRITVYNPDNDLIWEYETDWTRSASSDTRTFSPDVRMYWTHWSCWWVHHFK